MCRLILITAIITTLVSITYAQEFAGNYSLTTATGDVTFTVVNQGNNSYTGSLSGNGNNFPIQGVLQNGYLSGTLGSGTLGSTDELFLFEATVHGNTLIFTFAGMDANGQPVAATTQSLTFEKDVEGSVKTGFKSHSGDIKINGKVLSPNEIGALKQQYGVEPLAGDYWYDQRSGLYGVMGYAAYGFMYAGHDFGTLKRNASNGMTNVVINGREINLAEYTVWSYMLGYWIQAGEYWMDDKGNAGYEGSSVVLVNLFTTAQQNAYSGQRGSGDNFWSTKFSAGNSDQGGSRGYVSVPGYGPVGYGF